ncbi:MAG: DUF456 domain-containing protein, partial [Calditrichia bacterium]
MEFLDIIFIAVLGFSIFSNFLSIPGNFLVVVNTVWYGFATNFDKFSLSFLVTLLIIAVAVELVEYLIIAFGARRYGASRLAAIAAIAGGIIGSISGFFVSPFLGAILGGFIGVIAGTMLIDLV